MTQDRSNGNFRRERRSRLRRYVEQVKNGQVASVTGEGSSDDLLTPEAVMADYGPLTSTPPKNNQTVPATQPFQGEGAGVADDQ